MESGARTTEWWGGVVAPLAGVVAVFVSVQDRPTRITVIICATVALCFYLASRTWLKERAHACATAVEVAATTPAPAPPEAAVVAVSGVATVTATPPEG